MPIDIDDVDMSLIELAEALNDPKDGERYQTAKAALTYRQLKGQIEATEAQREAIGVQKIAAEAEAKAADAAIASAKAAEMAALAAERNAKYMLWSVRVAAIAAIFSVVSAVASARYSLAICASEVMDRRSKKGMTWRDG